MPVELPPTHVLCWIAGAFFLVMGIIGLIPGLADKVFKNAQDRPPAVRKAGAAACLALGIGLVVLGAVFVNA